MTNTKFWIASCALMVAAGCGDYAGGKQVSASRDETKEPRNFGSATDISKNGEMPTNAANAADNGLGGPVMRQQGNYRSQPLPGQNSDSELTSQIKVAITTGSTGTTGSIAENQLTKIDVQVREGNVTLSGLVSSEEEKKTIEKQISAFNGVKSVQNNLSVGARPLDNVPLQPLVPRTGANQ